MGVQKVWGVYLLVLWTFLSFPCLIPLSSVYGSLRLNLVPGSSLLFCFALLKAAAKKSITEVGPELVDLVEQLIDIVKNLQSQRHLPESGRDNELSSLGTVGSAGRGKDVLGARLGTASNWSNRNMFAIEGCSSS